MCKRRNSFEVIYVFNFRGEKYKKILRTSGRVLLGTFFKSLIQLGIFKSFLKNFYRFVYKTNELSRGHSGLGCYLATPDNREGESKVHQRCTKEDQKYSKSKNISD